MKCWGKRLKRQVMPNPLGNVLNTPASSGGRRRACFVLHGSVIGWASLAWWNRSLTLGGPPPIAVKPKLTPAICSGITTPQNTSANAVAAAERFQKPVAAWVSTARFKHDKLPVRNLRGLAFGTPRCVKKLHDLCKKCGDCCKGNVRQSCASGLPHTECAPGNPAQPRLLFFERRASRCRLRSLTATNSVDGPQRFYQIVTATGL